MDSKGNMIYISEINKQQTLVLSLNYLIEDLSTIIGIK